MDWEMSFPFFLIAVIATFVLALKALLDGARLAGSARGADRKILHVRPSADPARRADRGAARAAAGRAGSRAEPAAPPPSKREAAEEPPAAGSRPPRRRAAAPVEPPAPAQRSRPPRRRCRATRALGAAAGRELAGVAGRRRAGARRRLSGQAVDRLRAADPGGAGRARRSRSASACRSRPNGSGGATRRSRATARQRRPTCRKPWPRPARRPCSPPSMPRYALYGLLPSGVAFVLLAATAGAAVAQSLRHGPLVAALGLVGAYAVPLLVESDSPQALPLFAYLAVVTAGSLALLRHRAWWWLAWFALGRRAALGAAVAGRRAATPRRRSSRSICWCCSGCSSRSAAASRFVGFLAGIADTPMVRVGGARRALGDRVRAVARRRMPTGSASTSVAAGHGRDDRLPGAGLSRPAARRRDRRRPARSPWRCWRAGTCRCRRRS